MAEEFTADELTRSYAQAVELDARAGEALERTSQEAATANPCEVWHDIRPMVEDISNLWFIPRKIRALIKLVIAIVDSLCK